MKKTILATLLVVNSGTLFALDKFISVELEKEFQSLESLDKIQLQSQNKMMNVAMNDDRVILNSLEKVATGDNMLSFFYLMTSPLY